MRRDSTSNSRAVHRVGPVALTRRPGPAAGTSLTEDDWQVTDLDLNSKVTKLQDQSSRGAGGTKPRTQAPPGLGACRRFCRSQSRWPGDA